MSTTIGTLEIEMAANIARLSADLGAARAEVNKTMGDIQRSVASMQEGIQSGMGGVTAVPVYQVLGVDLIELFTKPDSTFPNHHPDPTVEENLEHLIQAVTEFEADLGIAFDGDGDRIGVVDEKGRIIWGDELMVLFSRAVLRERPGATIIPAAWDVTWHESGS